MLNREDDIKALEADKAKANKEASKGVKPASMERYRRPTAPMATGDLITPSFGDKRTNTAAVAKGGSTLLPTPAPRSQSTPTMASPTSTRYQKDQASRFAQASDASNGRSSYRMSRSVAEKVAGKQRTGGGGTFSAVSGGSEAKRRNLEAVRIMQSSREERLIRRLQDPKRAVSGRSYNKRLALAERMLDRRQKDKPAAGPSELEIADTKSKIAEREANIQSGIESSALEKEKFAFKGREFEAGREDEEFDREQERGKLEVRILEESGLNARKRAELRQQRQRSVFVDEDKVLANPYTGNSGGDAAQAAPEEAQPAQTTETMLYSTYLAAEDGPARIAALQQKARAGDPNAVKILQRLAALQQSVGRI